MRLLRPKKCLMGSSLMTQAGSGCSEIRISIFSSCNLFNSRDEVVERPDGWSIRPPRSTTLYNFPQPAFFFFSQWRNSINLAWRREDNAIAFCPVKFVLFRHYEGISTGPVLNPFAFHIFFKFDAKKWSYLLNTCYTLHVRLTALCHVHHVQRLWKHSCTFTHKTSSRSWDFQTARFIFHWGKKKQKKKILFWAALAQLFFCFCFSYRHFYPAFRRPDASSSWLYGNGNDSKYFNPFAQVRYSYGRR